MRIENRTDSTTRDRRRARRLRALAAAVLHGRQMERGLPGILARTAERWRRIAEIDQEIAAIRKTG